MLTQRYMCTPIFCSIGYSQPRYGNKKCLSMGEWIKKLWYMYIRILFSHKKEEIFPFVTTWMDFKGHYVRWNWSNKEKWQVWSLSYMWNIKQTKNQKLTDREQIGDCWGENRGMEMRNGWRGQKANKRKYAMKKSIHCTVGTCKLHTKLNHTRSLALNGSSSKGRWTPHTGDAQR